MIAPSLALLLPVSLLATQVAAHGFVSFVSADQACSNAEGEIGTSSFEEVQNASVALWNERLRRIEIDVVNTPENVTEMLYSSLYRASLTPVRPWLTLKSELSL